MLEKENERQGQCREHEKHYVVVGGRRRQLYTEREREGLEKAGVLWVAELTTPPAQADARTLSSHREAESRRQ